MTLGWCPSATRAFTRRGSARPAPPRVPTPPLPFEQWRRLLLSSPTSSPGQVVRASSARWLAGVPRVGGNAVKPRVTPCGPAVEVVAPLAEVADATLIQDSVQSIDNGQAASTTAPLSPGGRGGPGGLPGLDESRASRQEHPPAQMEWAFPSPGRKAFRRNGMPETCDLTGLQLRGVATP